MTPLSLLTGNKLGENKEHSRHLPRLTFLPLAWTECIYNPQKKKDVMATAVTEHGGHADNANKRTARILPKHIWQMRTIPWAFN